MNLNSRGMRKLIQSGTCNVDTTSFAVIAVRAPTPVNAGTDTTITQGQSITLNGAGTGKPFWSPSVGLNNDSLLKPTATPSVTLQIVKPSTIHRYNGCINRETIITTVKAGEYDEQHPIRFTPNGDGINDTWYIQNIQEFWDNKVFV